MATININLFNQCKRDAGVKAANELQERIKKSWFGEMLVIEDKDDKAYSTGLAQWLMDSFNYDNFSKGFRAYLTKPVNKIQSTQTMLK